MYRNLEFSDSVEVAIGGRNLEELTVAVKRLIKGRNVAFGQFDDLYTTSLLIDLKYL